MDLKKALKMEIDSIKERNPGLARDNAFVYWFLSAYLLNTENPEEIKLSIVGSSGDVNIDAYYIDESNKKVFLVQCKYRENLQANEKRNDFISFFALEKCFYDRASLDNLLINAREQIKLISEEIFHRLNKNQYELTFIYSTTGKVPSKLKKEMLNHPKYSHCQIFDGKALLGLFNDYLSDVAPPIPYIQLPIHDKQLIKHFDSETKINNRIFFVKTEHIKSIFDKNGIRLFARNIRGFLGDTPVNLQIERTLKKEPEHFLYLNNGITILCDRVKPSEENGEDILRIDNPQIINGQQTTRSIANEPSKMAKVLVRVISIPRETDDEIDNFSDMVNKIVSSTNYQNAIKPSDLRANDKEQIRIEKELRKYGYHYVRKRMAKSEMRKYYSDNFRFKVNRFDLIRSIAAVTYNPYLIRKGVEHLFEDDNKYRKLFSERSIREYLTYFWLYKLIKKQSDYERTYCMWYVMNDVYSYIKETLKYKANKVAFIYICERQSKQQHSTILKPLNEVIDRYYKLYSRDFFKWVKKNGREDIDLGSFFNSEKIHANFEKFYKNQISKNKKDMINKKIVKFINAIENFEIPDD